MCKRRGHIEHGRFTSWWMVHVPVLLRISNALAWRRYARQPERFATIHRPVIEAWDTIPGELDNGVPTDWMT